MFVAQISSFTVLVLAEQHVPQPLIVAVERKRLKKWCVAS